MKNGQFIRSTRAYPYPPRFELVQFGREDNIPGRLEESDAIRLAMRGWIALDSPEYGDLNAYSITQKGRDVLVSGVVIEALTQERLL